MALKNARQILCNVLEVALGLVNGRIGRIWNWTMISDIIYYIMQKVINISQQHTLTQTG